MNTLSSWMKHVLAEAYGMVPEDSSSVLHRSTHEIRALSTSLALFVNVGLEDIPLQVAGAQVRQAYLQQKRAAAHQ